MSRTGLWDTHAHLDDPAFAKDRKELLAQLEQDLDGIINAGCDAPSSAMAVELAEQYPFIYAAVGYHPENLKGIAPNYLEQLAAWAVHPKVVAIGEIGLDYYWKENEPKSVQKRVFLEQIDLAKQFDLPIIIHDREAHGDTLDILRQYGKGLRGVFHCYSGSLEMTDELLRMGFYFGFDGPLTYPNSKRAKRVAAHLPLERMLIETDCPYLTPQAHRGQRNEPAYVHYVAEEIAALRGLDAAEVARVTTENAKRLFAIP